MNDRVLEVCAEFGVCPLEIQSRVEIYLLNAYTWAQLASLASRIKYSHEL